MAGKPKNIVGKTFGNLLVVERYTGKTPNDGCAYWVCKCSCGNTVVVRSVSLVSGNTKSCGCYSRQVHSDLMRKRSREGNMPYFKYVHGKSGTPEYTRFKSAKRRELKKKLDYNWTVDLDVKLRECCNYQCVVCGITQQEHLELYKEVLHVDHIFPLTLGGALVPGNVVLLCNKCNTKKGTKLVHELPFWICNSIVFASTAFSLYMVAVNNAVDVTWWKLKNIKKVDAEKVWEDFEQ